MHMVFCLHLAGNLSTNSFIYEEKKTQIVRFFSLCLKFVWIVYSIIGIFRRTSSGTYFYQHPCAMNKWCFFYSAFGLILYTPQLAAATRNKYGIGVRRRQNK